MVTLKSYTISYQKISFQGEIYWFAKANEKIVYLGFRKEEIFKIFSFKKYYLKEVNNLDDKKIKEYLYKYFNNPEYVCNLNDFQLLGTDFQKSVWKFLTTLKWGEVRTYQEIAQAVNKPNAVRAIASVIAKNPILFLIPCHRVVSKNNQVKYRGGPELKLKLLELEKSKH